MEINVKRESTQQKKQELLVGVGEFRILKFNPTRSEKNKIYGREDSEDDQELTYTGLGDEGQRTVRITAIMEEVVTGHKIPVTFFLEDKDATSFSGNKIYVNAVGQSNYADSEANLQDWFKKAMTYRRAKEGEDSLMALISSWLVGIELNIDRGGSKNNILLDVNRLFKGDVTELNDLVNSEFAGTVTSLVMIKTRKDPNTGVVTHDQKVFTKKFLPGYCIKYFKDFKGEIPSFVGKFITYVKGQHGPKDYKVLEYIRPYDERENPMSSDEPVIGGKKPQY